MSDTTEMVRLIERIVAELREEMETGKRCRRCGAWLSYGRCMYCDLPDLHLAEETERLGTFPAPLPPRRLFAEEVR